MSNVNDRPVGRGVWKKQSRTAMPITKKDEMIAILIRNQPALEAVKDFLTAEQVSQVSSAVGLVYQVVVAFLDEHGELPSQSHIFSDAQEAWDDNPELLTPEGGDRLNEFVNFAFDDAHLGEDIATSEVKRRIAVRGVKAFLEELEVYKFREEARSGDRLPVDYPAMLEEAKARVEQIQSLADTELEVPFPEGWTERVETKMSPCGIEFFDTFMGGGWAANEVVLYMAPMGSSKTTLACHGVSGSIDYADRLYNADPGSADDLECRRDEAGNRMLPLVVLVFTEGTTRSYRDRLMARMGRIPWTRLKEMRSLADLSDSPDPGAGKSPTGYEAKEFADERGRGEPHIPERTRLLAAADRANRHLLMIDCTDTGPNKRQLGRGGIPEIAAIIAGELRRRPGSYPLSFWVDHISALADRMAEADPEVDKKLNLVLKRIPKQVADKLCKPYGARAMLFHQLSGDANSKARSQSAMFHHADAAGSKSIAEYVDFAFVANMPDPETQLCRVDCTKHRAAPAKKTEIMQVDGGFSRVKKMGNYTYDPGRRQIVSNQDIEMAIENTSADDFDSWKAGKDGFPDAANPVSKYDVLNPTLYLRLRRLYGRVRVAQRGVRMDAEAVKPFGRPRLWFRSRGEQYHINCPFCRDTRQRCYVGYMYGKRDAHGRFGHYLVHCHNEDCLANADHFRTFNDRLEDRSPLAAAKVLPGVEDTPDAEEVPWPGTCQPLVELPETHPANRYLADRGFDPRDYAKAYDLRLCLECPISYGRFVKDRIIVPVYDRGVLRGWQARYVGEPPPKGSPGYAPKYYSCPGSRFKSKCVYNFDDMKQWRTGVVVEGFTDVMRFGRMGGAIFGKLPSRFQEDKLVDVFGLKGRSLVLLLDPEEFDTKDTRRVIDRFEKRLPGTFCAVKLPEGTDPGGSSRRFMRAFVKEEAAMQGVKVWYERLPSRGPVVTAHNRGVKR